MTTDIFTKNLETVLRVRDAIMSVLNRCDELLATNPETTLAERIVDLRNRASSADTDLSECEARIYVATFKLSANESASIAYTIMSAFRTRWCQATSQDVLSISIQQAF